MQPIYLMGTILEMIGSYFLYAYLVSRSKENCSIKDFFAPGIRKRELVFTIVVIGLTLSAGIYGQLKQQYSAMQCYINIMMLFLVAAMAWVDYREKIIPNVLVLVGIGCTSNVDGDFCNRNRLEDGFKVFPWRGTDMGRHSAFDCSYRKVCIGNGRCEDVFRNRTYLWRK